VARGPSANTYVALHSPVDPDVSVGIASGADGLPVLSFHDYLRGDVKVAHCDRANCAGANSITSLASFANWPSIAIGADGLPLIGYTDRYINKLKLFHCGNPGCTSDNTTLPLNASGGTRMMMGSDGLPLLHYNSEQGYYDIWYHLILTHCGDAACSSGNQGATLLENLGYSLAIGSDGWPVALIFAWNPYASAAHLSVTHCEDVACSSFSSASLLETDKDNVMLGGIASGADGLPVIGYTLNADPVLRFIHCGDLACASGNTATSLDAASRFMDIAVGSDGLPILAYQGDTGALKILHCGEAACSSGNAITTLETGACLGADLAIGADGLPVLSYAHDAELIFAHCGNVLCSPNLP